MDKRILKTTLLLSLVAVLLTGCKAEEAEQAPASETKETISASDATESIDAKTRDKTEESIYILNMQAEWDAAWKSLAQAYEKEKGISVEVVTPERGQYDAILQSELGQENMPTIFTIANPDMLKQYGDYTYDLKQSFLYNHLIDKTLAMEQGEGIAAIPSELQVFGIIYNKTILADYCSMEGAVIKSPDAIKSLDTLLEVATDINNRRDEINDEFGYDLTGAFTSCGLDSGSSDRFSKQLVSLPLFYEFKADACNVLEGKETVDGRFLDQYKAIWDMYISTSGADSGNLASGSLDSEFEFATYEAVFYQNGSWEYEALTKGTDADNEYFVTEEDLGMMPIYFGVDDAKQGLCLGSEQYWVVNSKAGKEKIDASLAFLEWVISSDEGCRLLTEEMGKALPFDTFSGQYESSNPFIKDAKRYLADGKTSVVWSYMATPNKESWQEDFVKALAAYAEGSQDWAMVKTAFVDGWANKWKGEGR